MSEALKTIVCGDVSEVEKRLMKCPQVEIPIEHHFAPGVYAREAFMPAGALVVGHAHKEECLNIVLSGSALVSINGKLTEVSAPFILKSPAGSRKIAYVLTGMRWVNIHPNATNETDPAALEDAHIEKSTAFLEYELANLAQLTPNPAQALNS